MPVRLVPRAEPLRAMLVISPVLAVLLSAIVAALLFAVLGRDPVAALTALFITPLNSLYGLAELGLKATPLLLCAIGIAIGCRANVWNIGAEGQFTIGAICGGGIALAFGGSGSWWIVPLMLIAGV